MKKILILGANSAIAQSVCRLWAEQGHSLYLVGRNSKKLDSLVTDLKVRGGRCLGYESLDLNDGAIHSVLIDRASQTLAGIDIVFLAFGELGDQKVAEQNPKELERSIKTNFLSPILLLSIVANVLEAQGRGTIVAISSVAGDRGRQSNYVYGAAKGALSLFLSGMRNRLYSKGVHVLDLKLGFVDTPMTAAIAKKGLLWSQPETVARAITRAVESRKNIAYIPFFWSWIMLIIRMIPESIFKRLRL